MTIEPTNTLAAGAARVYIVGRGKIEASADAPMNVQLVRSAHGRAVVLDDEGFECEVALRELAPLGEAPAPAVLPQDAEVYDVTTAEDAVAAYHQESSEYGQSVDGYNSEYRATMTALRLKLERTLEVIEGRAVTASADTTTGRPGDASGQDVADDVADRKARAMAPAGDTSEADGVLAVCSLAAWAPVWRANGFTFVRSRSNDIEVHRINNNGVCSCRATDFGNRCWALDVAGLVGAFTAAAWAYGAAARDAWEATPNKDGKGRKAAILQYINEAPNHRHGVEIMAAFY